MDAEHLHRRAQDELCDEHGRKLTALEKKASEQAEHIASMRGEITEIKGLLIRLDAFVRDPETFEEMRKHHLNRLAIEKHEAGKAQQTTRRMSIGAMIISGALGLFALIRQIAQ